MYRDKNNAWAGDVSGDSLVKQVDTINTRVHKRPTFFAVEGNCYLCLFAAFGKVNFFAF